MEQRSVIAQTTSPEGAQTTTRYRWMRHFFSEDLSPDNSPVIEIQRRAIWISIAIILQALDEIDHRFYMPLLAPYGGVIPFVLILGSFIGMWMAIRPVPLIKQTQHLQQHPKRWQRLTLLIILGLAIILGGIQIVQSTVMSFLPPQYSNDGTTLDTNAALLLLEGHNPYTDSNFLEIARRFQFLPSWTTPLREGQFANRLDYPTPAEFETVLDTDLKAGQAPEFESKVSYPALSFLTLVPFVLVKDYNVLPLYFLSYLLIIAIGWKFARPELRPWVLILGLANGAMWASVIGSNVDIFCTLLMILVWLLRDRSWLSALLLGVALATKQTMWFFVPFYAIMVWRQYGFVEMARRLALAGSLGLAINLPFILWNPHAFVAGILAPVADPMFPMGVGLISLSGSPLLPFFPTWVYSVLEGIAMLLAIAWYIRLSKHHPEAAMMLAVFPLFFAWRSLPSYFCCAAFPMFILMAAKVSPYFGRQPSRRAGRVPPDPNKLSTTDLVAARA